MTAERADAHARRARPGDQQREQKKVSRSKILQAARKIFEENPYARVSVDMIIEEASISRATFYRHFDDKFALARTLFEDLAVQIRDLWEELLEVRDPSLSDAKSWLVRHLEVVRREKVIGLIIRDVGLDDTTEAQTLEFYEILMEKMWGRRWDGQPDHFADLWSRSLLLLLQMDEFFYTVLTRNWPVAHEPLVNAMSVLLHEFLQIRNRELNSKR